MASRTGRGKLPIGWKVWIEGEKLLHGRRLNDGVSLLFLMLKVKLNDRININFSH